jgi:predicted kinase
MSANTDPAAQGGPRVSVPPKALQHHHVISLIGDNGEPRLIVTRGLPGAGKTTAALAWVSSDPLRRARVGRDVLREHVYCTMPMLTPAGERELSDLQRLIVMHLLDSGRSVVVDDTNLPDAQITEWADLATALAAGFEVWDLRDVPLAECVARDLARAAAGGRLVGVITTMATTGRPTVTAEPDTTVTPPWEEHMTTTENPTAVPPDPYLDHARPKAAGRVLDGRTWDQYPTPHGGGRG